MRNGIRYHVEGFTQMREVVVVMPIRGRIEQSVDSMIRLWKTASYPATYIAVGGKEEAETIQKVVNAVPPSVAKISEQPRLTYWQALALATEHLSDDTLVCMVANDVMPSMHWLRNALSDYEALQEDYVIGFNGDGYTSINGHSCHIMISMNRIRRYGGWPVWYNHNFGDTELVARAIAEKSYYKSPWAVLFHNHYSVQAITSTQVDAIYQEGTNTFMNDKKLFDQRKRRGWK